MQTLAQPYLMPSSQIWRISSHVAVGASSVWSTCRRISFTSIVYGVLSKKNRFRKGERFPVYQCSTVTAKKQAHRIRSHDRVCRAARCREIRRRSLWAQKKKETSKEVSFFQKSAGASQHFSNTVATPWPPPMQRVARPFLASGRLSISWSRVTMMRAPEQPTG